MNKQKSKNFITFYYKYIGNKVFLVVALAVISSLLEMIGFMMFIPLLVGNKEFFLKYTSNGRVGEFFDYFFTNSEFSILAIILAFVFKSAITYGNSIYQYKIRLEVYSRINRELLDSFMGLKYKNYLSFSGGWLQELFSKHVNNTSESIAQFTSLLALTVVSLSFLVSVVILSPSVLIGCLTAGLMGVLGYSYLSSLMSKHSSAEIRSETIYVTLIQRCLTSFKYLIVTGLSKKVILHMQIEIKNLISIKKQMHSVAAIATNFREPFILVTVLLLYYIEIKMGGRTASEFIVVIAFLYRALTSIFSLSMGWLEISKYYGSVNAVSEHLKFYPPIKINIKNEFSQYILSKPTINIRNVDFGHEANKHNLVNINLNLIGPQLVVIKGDSGAGKTTILNLIAGLYEPSVGVVEVMGGNPTKLTIDDRQKMIGFVSQETPLFDTSIQNNIALWNGIDNYKFIKILESVGLKELTGNSVSNANLGREGMSLSGGQRQRVLIARELYRDGKILLLDEPTSALDWQNESIILKLLKQISKERLVIIVSHSNAVEMYADKVFKVEGGSLNVEI